MGALTDFFSDSDTAKSSPISEQLLDNLYKVESSRNPKAVNEKSGALGGYQFLPSTVEMLGKKGIKFDPMKESEARNAARTYLEMLTEQNGGDVRKALAQYGGFVKQDPTEYVNKVLAEQSSPGTLSSFFNDELDQPLPTTGAGAGRGSYAGFNPELANKKNFVKPSQQPTEFNKNVASVLGPLLQARRDLGAAAANVGDVTIGSLLPMLGAPAQAIARPFTTPEKAGQIGEAITGYLSNPFGKATNTLNEPAYQNSYLNKLMALAGEAPKAAEKLTGIPLTAETIAAKTGAPIQDIQNAMQIAALGVAPKAATTVAELGGKGFQAIGRGVEAVKAQLPETTTPAREAQLAAEKAAKARREQALVGVGAAEAEANPFIGQITGEQTGRGHFPQVKLSTISENAPTEEQALRAQIAHEINPTGQVREGVITGNENTLRNEHQSAKGPNPSPEGEVYKQQIADEQRALHKYAENLVAESGADTRLTNDEQRGMRINDAAFGATPEGEAPSSVKGFLDQTKQNVYDLAKEKMGDTPVEPTHTEKLLDNPQWKATLKLSKNTDVAQGAAELIKLAKEVGFADTNGNFHPAGSVSAYDAVRKALNSQWSHENAKVISDINKAIDKDILEVADPKLYKLGDRIHQLQKEMFEANGFKKLFGETDKNGIVQSSTPLEKLPAKLNNLRLDEWRHVRDTFDQIANGNLRNAPEGMPAIPEQVRKAAEAARNEIDGALARDVYKAGADKTGAWNQNSVNNMLNSVVGEKIKETFNPDLVRKFHVLNYGGQIMPGVHAYEGGAAQAERIGGLKTHLPAAGESAGALVGGFVHPFLAPVGAWGGRKLGEKGMTSATEKQMLEAAQQAREKMQRNAQLPKIMGLGE